MRTIACVLFVVALFALCTAVFAEGKAVWGKDQRLLCQWFADNANATKFLAWAEDNMSQEQVSALEVLMFPSLPEDSKRGLLDVIKVQLQGANIEKSEDPKEKAVYEAVLSALDVKTKATADNPAGEQP